MQSIAPKVEVDPSQINPYNQIKQASTEMSANANEEVDDILKREHWMVKSVTEMNRIFMIDVTSKGVVKIQIEVIFHFVN